MNQADESTHPPSRPQPRHHQGRSRQTTTPRVRRPARARRRPRRLSLLAGKTPRAHGSRPPRSGSPLAHAERMASAAAHQMQAAAIPYPSHRRSQQPGAIQAPDSGSMARRPATRRHGLSAPAAPHQCPPLGRASPRTQTASRRRSLHCRVPCHSSTSRCGGARTTSRASCRRYAKAASGPSCAPAIVIVERPAAPERQHAPDRFVISAMVRACARAPWASAASASAISRYLHHRPWA